MSNLFYALISTFIGGAIGSILAEVFRRRRAKTERQELKRNIQTLIYLEVDHNLAILREFWTSVDTIRGPTPLETDFLQCTTFTSTIFPKWGRLMWESQASNLPTALTEATIQRLYALYDQLDLLLALKSHLREALPTHVMDDYANFQHERIERRIHPEAPPSIENWSRWSDFKGFSIETQELWQKARIMIVTVVNTNFSADLSLRPTIAPLSRILQSIDAVLRLSRLKDGRF